MSSREINGVPCLYFMPILRDPLRQVMAFKLWLAILFHACTALATWTAYEEYLANLPSTGDSERPHITYEPNKPWQPLPSSPPRSKTCEVKSHDDMKTDDSQYIMDALHECNNGGRVLFPVNRTYVIGKAIDMQFLQHVDLGEDVPMLGSATELTSRNRAIPPHHHQCRSAFEACISLAQGNRAQLCLSTAQAAACYTEPYS